jgi:hypothetical protein
LGWWLMIQRRHNTKPSQWLMHLTLANKKKIKCTIMASLEALLFKSGRAWSRPAMIQHYETSIMNEWAIFCIRLNRLERKAHN